MRQAKRVVEALSPAEREDLTILAVTLDPERDTPKALGEMARFQGVEAPLWHLLSGEASEVNRVLDGFGFSRRKDPDTGIIDHANLFLLVDRGGRVAYRFTLGDTQEPWQVSALRLLLQERTSRE